MLLIRSHAPIGGDIPTSVVRIWWTAEGIRHGRRIARRTLQDEGSATATIRVLRGPGIMGEASLVTRVAYVGEPSM